MTELSERELQRHLGKMRLQSPYDMYELWQGCGPELVEEKFVEMTHRYHPDHFASNPGSKRLAQEIFMLIVQARGTLRRQEKRQTVPPPVTAQEQASRDEGFRRLASRPRIPNPRSKSLDALSQASEAYESLQQDSAPSAIPVAPTPSRNATSEPEDSEAARQARLLALQNKRRPNRLARFRTNPGSSAGDTLSQPSDVNMSEAERQQRLQALARKRPGAPTHFVEAMRQSSVASSTSDVISAASDDVLHASSSPSSLPTSGIRPESHTTLSVEMLQDLSAREAFNYGYREYKLQRYENALEALKHAYELEPDNGLYTTFYGYTLFQVAPGELPSAEKLLRKAVDLGDSQSLPDAHLFLGLVLKRRGGKRMNEAMRHFQTAFELNPASHEAERELRLHETRMKKKQQDAQEQRSFFGKLFKK